MKLGVINIENEKAIILIVDDGFINVSKHLIGAPDTLQELVGRWSEFSAGVKQLEARAADGKLDTSRLEAPIERPGKIFAMGLNYADHCEESNMPLPDKQIWFTKAKTAINAPFAPLELPYVSEQLDYEVEMVVVIGKTCRNVPADRVDEVIFGYCVGNDVSVRDWQIATPQWSLGKSFDKSAPIGPWITTADAVDPNNLGIRSYVNGELRQNSNTRHLVFKAKDMIAQLSQAMTLEPGDLIFTGTPGGVGMVWNGAPHFLKAGDVSRVEIDELGMIEATVKPGTVDIFIAG